VARPRTPPQPTPTRPLGFLRAWEDAPAFLLSCPGPLRRHHDAVQPMSQLRLPQCLLGSEAQMLAFVAAVPELAGRMFFVPLPEMFSSAQSADALAQACGLEPAGLAGPRLVHLRFGGTRSARVLKDARNGLILAENHQVPPITASRHPFARGLTVPASMRRIFAVDAAIAVPQAMGGADLPVTVLEGTDEDSFIAADLAAAGPAPRRTGARKGQPADGLDLMSLAEFRSNAWAAGGSIWTRRWPRIGGTRPPSCWCPGIWTTRAAQYRRWWPARCVFSPPACPPCGWSSCRSTIPARPG
jgi:hypothetical protein